VSSTTATKMLEHFREMGILRETTGKKRYRLYRYDAYVELFDPVTAGDVRLDETMS